jgi:hypothetical protein
VRQALLHLALVAHVVLNITLKPSFTPLAYSPRYFVYAAVVALSLLHSLHEVSAEFLHILSLTFNVELLLLVEAARVDKVEVVLVPPLERAVDSLP